jgi:hypothetical protein
MHASLPAAAATATRHSIYTVQTARCTVHCIVPQHKLHTEHTTCYCHMCYHEISASWSVQQQLLYMIASAKVPSPRAVYCFILNCTVLHMSANALVDRPLRITLMASTSSIVRWLINGHRSEAMIAVRPMRGSSSRGMFTRSHVGDSLL